MGCRIDDYVDIVAWTMDVVGSTKPDRGYSPQVASMHTYDTSENTRIWMGWLRTALNARGFTQPLWLGEAGIAWQEMQAQWYSDHVRNMFTYGYWTNTILFKLHEGPPPNDNTGIYNYDLTPKPAVEALRSVCAPYSPPPPDPCGNVRCEGNEPLTCPGDCPYCNGDGYCDVYAGECATNCPMDCVSGELCQ